MHIGILKTDAVRPEWVDEFGEYPDMFQRLVLAANSDVSFSVWDVEEGVRPTPAEIDAVDGFIITGSKSSAYDDKEWIRDLERLVQELHARRKKMVGICFGHQVIARALGGTVAKSDKGWGVGVNVYNVSELPVQGDDEVRGDESGFLKLVVSHQDQVTVLPPGARNVVSNDHCENAGFVMGGHIFTLQGHPEFSAEYSQAIMAFRHDMIGAERVAQGRASLVTHQHEGPRVARWMVDFLSA
ncbi:GMP synthase [Luminiphilus sp.]|nr:GMP synthase [Luminiphilus sp.]